ncbi:MAG: putative metalloprotease CJM1_0395 family protein [Candidatus Nitricoxidivorans perseverans]|uniref:Metalloprotease CJM1_0395 family protein n=1 Tax=Candidatus Nitricoxidivorans perseverans TaxID=2975601 RepID=A0AA49FIG0_9PROT|nr:MAG: putative metalloprotease CJM1_0395 family protein [Candidatus Nitricoxidivorans perseverans]
MTTLDSSLRTIGISRATGVELVMQRDQAEGTLPRSEGAAERKYAARELSTAEIRRIRELKQVDRTVREHEAAHLRAGSGVVTSGANFTYTYGPDGKQYAVAGEVGIDTSPEKKPEDNIDKGERIQIAALAPKDPSPQDYRVAAIGSQLEAQGQTDLAIQQREEAAAAAEARQAAQQPDQSPESSRSAPDRPLATESPAARNERAPNAEPAHPAADLNDATRQRISRAYAPVGGKAEAALSVFA